MNEFLDRFFVPEGTYFLTHSVGCQPRGVEAAVTQHFQQPWQDKGGDAWPVWLEGVQTFQKHLASLFHAQPNEFCPQVNLSSALNKIIHGLPKRPNRKIILLSELDFPSIGFVAEQATRSGYELRFIKKGDDVANVDVWKSALDDDVQLVLATHVLSNTGQQLPVEKIAESAREHRAYSVIDIAQSAGIVPLDFQQLKSDFVIGSCVKWLCGGPGAGFLWAASAITKDIEPIDVGWFSHADPFEFDIHHFRYAEDASRFMGGTPSILPFVVASVGLQLILEIGIDALATHNRRLIDELLTLIPEHVVSSPLEATKRSGTIILKPMDNKRFATALTQASISYDERTNGFRFSPHIYNTSHDIQALAQCVRRAHN